ncbi:MAG: hypothetical protein KGO02_21675 [Alphaproteobacteria bacterium]|nr:hypothetical protein [Alphaproteobacteria bacterium]
MTLLEIHIVAASAWLGLVGGETVMELHARGPSAQRLIARMHKWIDILFEGPLVATVLVTGSVLLWRVWPPSPLLVVKIAAAMVAVIANFICIPLVQARAKAQSDEALRTLTRKIGATGVAIPFGLAALAIALFGV